MYRMCRRACASLALVASAMFLTVAATGLLREAQAQDMPKPPAGAAVHFVEPMDGAKVKSPVKLRFEATKIETVPAGAVQEGSGHHHVIIDDDAPAAGQVIPADATHVHFGKAQTEATIELKPGTHKLTLQFADGLHRSYGPKLSTSIMIEVVP